MGNIPQDPMMLMSFINMKLRDFYPSLSAFCEDAEVEEDMIREKLAAIDYEYDPETNQFV